MWGVKDDTGFRNLLINRLLCFINSRFFPVASLVITICLLSFLTVSTACAQGPGSRAPGGSNAVPINERNEQSRRRVSNRAYSDRLDQPIVDIRVKGNVTIPSEAILRKVSTQLNRKPSQKRIREDIQTLYQTRWFFNVSTKMERTEKGLVLTFVVQERPIVEKIEYRGNKKIKDKALAELTGLRDGSPFDVSANIESAQRLQEYYKEKGYFFAEVKLVSGDKRDQREVIFDIKEGFKVRVQKVTFDGNKFVAGGVLKTKLETKRAILWKFGGLYNPSTIPNDLSALKQYYTNYGYFDISIKHKVSFSDDKSKVYLHYDIDEGERYKIRKRIISGNEVFSEAEITQEMELGANQFFNARHLGKDVRTLKAKYGKLGRFYAKVNAFPRFLDKPGEADLIYEIDEDEVYVIRKTNIHILGDYPHTKETVGRNRMRIHPGDLADPNLIRLSESRLGGSQIFERQGGSAPRIKVTPVTPENGGRIDPNLFRGQSSEKRRSTFPNPSSKQATQPNLIPKQSSFTPKKTWNSSEFGHSGAPVPALVRQIAQGTNTQTGHQNTFGNSLFNKRAVSNDELLTSTMKSDWNKQVDAIFRGQSPQGDFDPIFDPNIEQTQIETPANPLYNVSPQGDPFGNSLTRPRELDLDVYVTEARTGRFMIGVGVNSDSGVAGNIVLEEQNFDLFRPPTSFQDIINGTAWRGAGQRFRLEAVPGSEIGRYVATWTDPHFNDTDYSLGVSGFYFTRFYPDWDEQRTGGRVTLGKQLTPEWTVSGALRFESVEVDDPSVPTPQELTDALGDSFLTTLRGAVTHDTRDASFMAGEGHLVELSYEQAVGDFSFPKLGLEASQYHTIRSRPDGGGRHIVSLSGQLGWTGSDTPIYEQYYAGGFQTFRGFAFRGVGPVTNSINTGGEFMALGSVEYIFPLMADETIQAVAFTDFGSVEDDVSLDHFRMSIGGGLRVSVPAMGPVPLAFDWAYPIMKEDFDEKRLFSFYVGFTR